MYYIAERLGFDITDNLQTHPLISVYKGVYREQSAVMKVFDVYGAFE